MTVILSGAQTEASICFPESLQIIALTYINRNIDKIIILIAVGAVGSCRRRLLLLIHFVMAILLLQFPHILMWILHVVVAHLLENFLEIANRLIGDFHEILNIVVLMLFKGIEQHIHNGIFVVARLLALGLLSLFVLNVVFVIGHRLEVLHDFVERLKFTRRNGGRLERFNFQLHVCTVSMRTTFQLLHDTTDHIHFVRVGWCAHNIGITWR